MTKGPLPTSSKRQLWLSTPNNSYVRINDARNDAWLRSCQVRTPFTTAVAPPSAHTSTTEPPPLETCPMAHRDELRGDDLHGAEVEGDHVHISGDLLDRSHDVEGRAGVLRVKLFLQLHKLFSSCCFPIA